jgi:protein SCO1/2
MNESAVLRVTPSIALLLALLLGGCRGEAGPRPLEGASMGGPFTLTSHEGRRVGDAQFAGKYRLVYFGFTFCPDVCPADLQAIGAGLRRFEQSDAERAAKVQPIFITVDPARDTPDVLRRYVANFHPRLIGLTGTDAEIAAVARAYGIYYQRGRPAPGRPAGEYAVDHSRQAVLYDPNGRPIVIVPADQGADAVAAELDRWVR